VRGRFAGRGAEERPAFGAVEDPEDEEVGEAFDVGQAFRELGEELDRAGRDVLRAGAFRDLGQLLERRARMADGDGREKRFHDRRE